MPNFLTCPTCNGKKTILGMGMLEHKCDTCVGLGRIEQPAQKTESEDDSRETNVNNAANQQVTHRGRKSKKAKNA